jgi:serine/threonine protein phosphatase PrpC
MNSKREQAEAAETGSSNPSELPTQPYHPENDLPQRPLANPKPFQVGIGSSIGRQREHNEDALFTSTTNLITNNGSIPMGLYIVADGMGGHVHGEKASEVAIQAMVQHVLAEIIPPALGIVAKYTPDNLKEVMAEGIRAAHLAIQENAPGGGSTLTGLLLLGDLMIIAHIGDSRAYLYESEAASEVLTTDHSLVKRLEDLGQITPAEAAIHPQRNVLYRALGQVEQIEAELIATRLPPRGYISLCSDGLWGAVSDQEMQAILHRSADPQAACESLLEAANAAGGPDNISVIIIKIPD